MGMMLTCKKSNIPQCLIYETAIVGISQAGLSNALMFSIYTKHCVATELLAPDCVLSVLFQKKFAVNYCHCQIPTVALLLFHLGLHSILDEGQK